MTQQPRIFYGWYIVAITIVGMGMVYGLRNSFSVFFRPILNEFGWERGSTAIMLSMSIFIYGLMAPVAGSLADRWKPKRVMLIGVTILGAATAGCAFATELWHFYVLFGVISPIGTALSGSPVFYPALTNWFAKRRELAIGLGQIGGGLSFAFSMLTETLISRLGWRHSYFALAGIMLAVLLPLYGIVFFHHPRDKGMTPYIGDTEKEKQEPQKVTASMDNGWTLGRALRSYRLWFLVLSNFLFWGIGNYLVLAHQIKFAQDVGFSSTFATSVFAFFGIVSIFGQLCAPISNRIGREQTVVLAAVLAVGAMIALVSVKDVSQPWLLYVYAILSGLATGLYSPTTFVAAADIFYGKHYGGISAMILTGMGFGGAIGPWLGGYIYDVSGSYDLAFYICIGSFVVSCFCFWIAAPRRNFTPSKPKTRASL